MAGVLLLGLVAKLFQAVGSDPLVGITGLVLAVGGCVAIWWRLSLRRRLTVRTLADLLAVSPSQFEHETANFLHDLGYTDVKRTGGSGDLNVDVWARDPQGKRVAVQCKQYGPGHSVGSPEVQTFIGMIYQHHGADRGMFVTTSVFTAPAADLAKAHNIQLLDGGALSRQIGELNSRDRRGSGHRAHMLGILGLPVGLFLLAYVWQEPDRAVPVAAVAAAAAPSPVLSMAPTAPPPAVARPAPATVQAVPPTLIVQNPVTSTLVIANTGGVGAYIRRTPVLEDKLRAYPDGTALRILGPDVYTDGDTVRMQWRHVTTLDGVRGYVPADYVSSAPQP